MISKQADDMALGGVQLIAMNIVKITKRIGEKKKERKTIGEQR